jgi:hypothetical protein
MRRYVRAFPFVRGAALTRRSVVAHVLHRRLCALATMDRSCERVGTGPSSKLCGCEVLLECCGLEAGGLGGVERDSLRLDKEDRVHSGLVTSTRPLSIHTRMTRALEGGANVFG